MNIITAVFALGIALSSIGVVVAFVSLVSVISAFDEEGAENGKLLFVMSAIAVLVGAFIIGLTAQGATA